jgi:hypothetical protein
VLAALCRARLVGSQVVVGPAGRAVLAGGLLCRPGVAVGFGKVAVVARMAMVQRDIAVGRDCSVQVPSYRPVVDGRVPGVGCGHVHGHHGVSGAAVVAAVRRWPCT